MQIETDVLFLLSFSLSFLPFCIFVHSFAIEKRDKVKVEMEKSAIVSMNSEEKNIRKLFVHCHVDSLCIIP